MTTSTRVVQVQAQTQTQAKFQSGPGVAPNYVSAMDVNPITNEILLTGSTYDSSFANPTVAETNSILETSNCFIARLEEDSINSIFIPKALAMFGTNGIIETCRSITSLPNSDIADYVVVGQADPSGLYAKAEDGVTVDNAQVAFAMVLKKSDSVITADINSFADAIPDRLAGSSLFVDKKVVTPHAVVADPQTPNRIYVAAMYTDDVTPNNLNESYPNWSHTNKIGKGFAMAVTALELTTASGTGTTTDPSFEGVIDTSVDQTPGVTPGTPILKTLWTEYFPVAAETPDAFKEVYVGGMIWKEPGMIIVAGSTAAQGDSYGPSDGQDEDGYIAILDPATGQLMPGRINSQRFGTQDYDVVTSLCHDPNDPTSFYIVGGTTGQMDVVQKDILQPPQNSLQAFIKKVNVDTLVGVWTVQHGGQNSGTRLDEPSQMSAVACAVKDDVIYMTGVIAQGAGVIQGSKVHNSAGGDDVFVVQYDRHTGMVNWIQQFGTPGDEDVALGNGIRVDQDGNAIVFGDTNGPMYRDREVGNQITDVYGLTLRKSDGSFATTVGGLSANQVVDPDAEGINDVTNDPFADDDEDTPSIIDPKAIEPRAVISSESQVHQSGPNLGALYAAGFVVDKDANDAIFVGITYTESNGRLTDTSSCLVARIELGTMKTLKSNVLGADDQTEACRSIAFHKDTDGEIVIVGNADTKGILADNNPDPDKIQLGFGMTLDPTSLAIVVGDDLFATSAEQVPYPQSVRVDDQFLYVASMTSLDTTENSNNSGEFPNWTYLNKYGRGFEMTIERLDKETYQTDWSKTYPVDRQPDGTQESVFVGGLLLKDGQLVAVGSTRAKGEAYGPADGDDEDGFITLLNPANGELLSGNNNNARVGTYEDDIVTHVCDVPNEPGMIVIVGATKGDFEEDYANDLVMNSNSLMWFAQKVDITDLSPIWTIQGGARLVGDKDATTSSFALGCQVGSDDQLFIAGTVENGASMVLGEKVKESAGSDDIWVASLDITEGVINWMSQFGSPGDDRLARGNGLSIDAFGNPVVFGDTTGALLRDRAIGSNTDIFLAVLNASDGSFATRTTPAPVSVPTPNPTPAPVLPPTEAPVTPPVQQGGTTSDGDDIPDDIVALQLGPDLGPSFAGGMDYVRDTNSIYLTGATYGVFSGPGVRARKYSSCFFARIDLPELEVIQRETYGVDTVADACSAIAVNDLEGSRDAIVLGSTDAGGLLTDLSETVSVQYGFAMDLTQQAKFEFLGGSIVGEESKATFPVAIYVDGENFYTVSMSSSSDDIEADFKQVDHPEFPNYTVGGVVGFTTTMDMTVEAFEVTKAGDGNPFAQGAAKTFESKWHKKLETVSKETIFVTGLIPADGGLVAVGTTPKDGHINGIMAKLNLENGEFLDDGDGSKSIAYFAATNDLDDVFITGACPDPDDDQFFYVVGATSGVIDPNSSRASGDVTYHAVLSKINVKTLEPEWVKQYKVLHQDGTSGSKAAASAFGCEALHNENIVYIAGTVENGATMADASPNRPSAGRDDIFVAQVSTLEGRLNWMKQVGSNGDDRVARGNPVRVDARGNAVVFGDTTGDFFRSRSEDQTPRFNDLFLIVFDKQYGIHQEPLVGPRVTGNPYGDNGAVPHQFFNGITSSSAKKGWQIILILVLVASFTGVFYFCYKRFWVQRGYRRSKHSGVVYDASAADLSFHENGPNDALGAAGLFRDDPNGGLDGSSGYRDSPMTLDDGGGGLVGNFHKTYSDLPRNGKEII